MVRLYLIVGLAAVIFTIYAAIDCAMTDHRRARGIPKALWILVIIVLPSIGALLWFTLGKDRSGGSRQVRTTAPDDDPAFLCGLNTNKPGTNQSGTDKPGTEGKGALGTDADQEERIRRLEQALAELDDDSKD